MSCLLTLLIASAVIINLGFHSIQFLIDGKPLVKEPITAFYLNPEKTTDSLDDKGMFHLPWGFKAEGMAFLKVRGEKFYFKVPKFGRIVHNIDTKNQTASTKYIWDFIIFTLNKH